MSDVTLQIGAARYGGWESISIRRSIEQIAGTFRLDVSERWPGQATQRPINPGDRCQVRIDGEVVITGHVDDVGIRYDTASHGVSVAGRDATGDLVDCSAPPTQWKGRTLPQVAADLCKPYGITVRDLAGVDGTFKTLANNDGDTVFDTLEAAARVRGVLLVSDGQGGLLITRAGTVRVGTALKLGENLLSASFQRSWRDRFHRYTVKDQQPGDDFISGPAAAQVLAHSIDAGVTRHRPFTVLAEEPIDASSAQARADWARNVRFGRAQELRVHVAGWRHADGLWEPNTLASIADDVLGIHAMWLIVGVDYRMSNDGEIAELRLMPPEAFARVPLPEPEPDANSVPVQ